MVEKGVEVLYGMVSSYAMANRCHEHRTRELAAARPLTLDEQLRLCEPPGFAESQFDTRGRGRAAHLPPWWPGALAEEKLVASSDGSCAGSQTASASRRVTQSRSVPTLPGIRVGDPLQARKVTVKKKDLTAHLRQSSLQMSIPTTKQSTYGHAAFALAQKQNDPKWSKDLLQLNIDFTNNRIDAARQSGSVDGACLPERPVMHAVAARRGGPHKQG